MKNTNNIKLALRDATNAVNLLDKRGYKVIGVSMNHVQPIITISTPPASKTPKGTEILCIRERGAAPERIMAAPFNGCLVTWNADDSAMQ